MKYPEYYITKSISTCEDCIYFKGICNTCETGVNAAKNIRALCKNFIHKDFKSLNNLFKIPEGVSLCTMCAVEGCFVKRHVFTNLFVYRCVTDLLDCFEAKDKKILKDKEELEND